MPVRFQGQELIPAPLVQIQETFSRLPNGIAISPIYGITLIGTIVNVDTDKDSPASLDWTGTDGPTMEGILAEQKRLRELFSTDNDGGRLEIETPDGGGPNTIDFYCIIEGLNFNSSVWVNRCDYTVNLRAYKAESDDNGPIGLSSYNENWNITENEDGTFSITHQINAVGQNLYGPSGISDSLGAARNWCQSRMSTIDAGGDIAINGSGYIRTLTPITNFSNNYWNLSVIEGIGSVENSWQITENFIHYPSGSAREEYNMSIAYENNDNNRAIISINGSVFGFADRNADYPLKLQNAKNQFNTSTEPSIISRVGSILPAGYTLNPIPMIRRIEYETRLGAIRYNYNYSAVLGIIIPGAIEENITISDTGISDIFASIPVPGRAQGPIIQAMKTINLPERSVNIQALMASSGLISLGTLNSVYLSKPNTDDIINALKPSAGYYYIRIDNEEFNPIRKQYSRQVVWSLQPDGNTIPGIPNTLNNLPN